MDTKRILECVGKIEMYANDLTKISVGYAKSLQKVAEDIRRCIVDAEKDTNGQIYRDAQSKNPVHVAYLDKEYLSTNMSYEEYMVQLRILAYDKEGEE